MAITVQVVSDSVGDLLIDANRTRWPLAERVRWINESMGAIMTRRPAAFTRLTVHPLAEGPLQVLPEGGALLLDVISNMTGTVEAPVQGNGIRRTDRQLLDDSDPDWQTGTAKEVVKQYTYDDRMPLNFFVYPPIIAGTLVRLADAALPEPVAALDDEIGIADEYLEAVVNYVCYRCNCKDSEYANSAAAMAFYAAFQESLGIKSASAMAASPNQATNSV